MSMRSSSGERGEFAELGSRLFDPVLFVTHVFDADLWWMQQRILRSVANRPRTAVKACHASGKTMLAAMAVLWWIVRYRDGIAITTAPTWEQVRDLLWGEIHKALLRSRYPYPQVLQTELRFGPGNYALGLSTNRGVRFQGFHGEHLLIVMDEAPGVAGDIWEAIEGARAGGQVRLLALGNPTIASGPFHDAFTTNREGWSTFTIDAFQTPNLEGFPLEGLRAMKRGVAEDALEFASPARPYLVTRRWVYEKFHEWGERSPLWQARVRGQFPEQAEDALVSLAWLEAARWRRKEGAPNERLYAGVDVAGPGEDETCAAVRSESGRIVAIRAWQSADARGEAAAFLGEFRARLEIVNVDSIGIGYHFGLHLQDLGFPVQMINVGEPSRDSAKFANAKAEFYWGLRMRLEAGDIGGLDDEIAIGQLAGIRYRHNPRGQIQIESKEEARKRGVKSPDRAEAIMLAFASRTPGIIEYYREKLGDGASAGAGLNDLAEEYERAIRAMEEGEAWAGATGARRGGRWDHEGASDE
jgi:phage terminase large subunit